MPRSKAAPLITPDASTAPRKPSFRERQKQLREDEIVTTAAALLGSKGYAGMTLDDVANEVGISKPTLYQHFVSKEDLGARILLNALQKAQEHLAELARELPPRDAAKAMIEWGIETHFGGGAYRDLKAALFLYANPAVRDAERGVATSLAVVVERGQKAGTIPRLVPALMIAQTFSAILKNAAHEDDYRKGELTIEQLKAQTVGLLLGEAEQRQGLMPSKRLTNHRSDRLHSS
jgi:AcrR family transcriptional regulator